MNAVAGAYARKTISAWFHFRKIHAALTANAQG